MGICLGLGVTRSRFIYPTEKRECRASNQTSLSIAVRIDQDMGRKSDVMMKW